MGERINRTDEVRGSSPLSSTHGAVAKLGSRLNGIEKAEGSSPSGSTNWQMADSLWLMAYGEE